MKSSVDSFADYEQLAGGVETLFKGSADVVKDYADGAFKTAGMSANDYMDTVTSFSATLLQSLGGDTAAAADMADLAITDMSDNANKMGTDISMIQNAYQGFAKQNYTMLDNLKLGYGGTAREMARLVNESGLLSEAQKINLDDTQKLGEALQNVGFDTIIQAIHEVQTQMGITGTTAAEAADTISGSVSSMKAAWDNWLVGLANPDVDIDGMTQTLVDAFGTVVDNVLPVVWRIGESLVQVFSDMTGIDLSPAIAKIREFSEKVTDLISAVKQGFEEGDIPGAVDAIIGKIDEWTELDLSGVREKIKESIDGIKTAFEDFKTAYEENSLSGLVDEIVDKFAGLTGINLAPITDGISGLFKIFSDTVTGPVGDITQALSGFVNMFKGDGDEWTGVLNTFVEYFGKLIGYFGESAASSVSIISQGITGFIKTIKENNISDDLLGIADAVGRFFEKLDEVKQTFSQFKEELDIILGSVSKLLHNVAGDIASLFTGVLGPAIDGINSTIGIFVNLIKGDLPGALTELKNSVQATADEIKAIWDFVTGLIEDIMGFGYDVVDGALTFATGKTNAERQQEKYNTKLAQSGNEIYATREEAINAINNKGNVDFSNSGLGKSSAGLVGGIAASQVQNDININMNVDGRTVAEVTYDPLNNIARQKGNADDRLIQAR